MNVAPRSRLPSIGTLLQDPNATKEWRDGAKIRQDRMNQNPAWKRQYKQAVELIEQSTTTGDLQGKRTQALRLLQKLLHCKLPTAKLARIHTNVGALLQERDELEQAKAHYYEALVLEPSYWKAHYNLGLALKDSSQLMEALDHLEIALTARPNHSGILKYRDQVKDRLQVDADNIYKCTADIRQFAFELVEAAHLVSSSCRPRSAMTSIPPCPERAELPDLITLQQEWQGGMGNLLHRMYIKATVLNATLVEYFRHYDCKGSGYISHQHFDEILCQLGTYALDTELQELRVLFPSNEIWYSILTPSEKTAMTMRLVRRQGATPSSFFLHPQEIPDRKKLKLLKEIPLLKWIESCCPFQDNYHHELIFNRLLKAGIYSIESLYERHLDQLSLKRLQLPEDGHVTLLLKGLQKLEEKLKYHAAILIQSVVRRTLSLLKVRRMRELLVQQSLNRKHAASRRIQRCYLVHRDYSSAKKLIATVETSQIELTIASIIDRLEKPELEYHEHVRHTKIVPLRTETGPSALAIAKFCQQKYRTKWL